MYEWDEDEGPSRGRTVVIAATLVALAALGWFVVRPALTDDEAPATEQSLPFDTTESTSSGSVALVPPTGEPTAAADTSAAGSGSVATISESTDALQPATSDGAVPGEPDTSAPASSDLTTTEAPATELAATETASTTPASTDESVATDATTTGPATTDAITTEPADTSEPTTTAVVGEDLVAATDLSTTEPETTEPTDTTEPATTDATTTEPTDTTTPPTTDATTTEPTDTTTPPTTDATTTEPTDTTPPPTTDATTTEPTDTTTPPTTDATTTEPTDTTPPPTTDATTTEPTDTTTPPTTELVGENLVAATDLSTTEPETTEPTDTTEPATTDATTTEPATTEPATTTSTTTIAPTTTSPPTTLAPTTLPPTSVAGVPYDTMPDGSPVPVVAIFDDDRITVVGAVPSEQAAQQLIGLALANSQFPGVPVDNRLTINPNVPVGVGVRVLELNSVRFAEGSAEITPEHALQFDRVAGLMNAFPNITVVVVGHADQRGDEASNLVLAQRRADAVVAYLAGLGIEGSRISARSVGEADLLTVDDDEASLALNRRTEFILYGVLVPLEAPQTSATPTTAEG